MPYLADAASPPATPRIAAGRDNFADGRAIGGRSDQHDNSLDAARGIAIAVLLALPVWGAVALAIRWLLRL